MSDDPSGAGRQTAIGAFVLGGIGLALAAIVMFGKSHFFSPTVQAAVVFQDSVHGLSVGAPVNFRGVRVGSVESITVVFDPKTQTAFIPVTIQLEPKRVILEGTTPRDGTELSQVVGGGLRAELATQSFVTGQSEIDLDFDPKSVAALHPNITKLPEIPTRLSTIQKVEDQLSQLPLRELADNANATVQSLRTLSEKLVHTLPPLIESLQSTSERAGAAIDSSSRAITALQARADLTLSDISRLANSGTMLVSQRGAELHTLLASANQTIAQAHDLLADLKAVTSERGADRANVDSTLRDLATASAALRGLASEVEHNPQLLLTGRRP